MMSPATRVIAAAAGLFCFFPTYDLLLKPGVPVFAWGMAPFWIMSLAALAIGLPLLIAAILGISRTIVFDPAARHMSVSGSGGFGIRWSRTYAFRDLAPPSVVRQDDSDGPPSFQVQVRSRGRKRPIDIERFKDESEADACAARVAALLLQSNGPASAA